MIGFPFLKIIVNDAAKNEIPNKKITIKAKYKENIKMFCILKNMFISKSKK